MIKKEYIQPEVKEVKVILPTILADSIVNPETNWTLGSPIDEGDPEEPVDAGGGL